MSSGITAKKEEQQEVISLKQTAEAIMQVVGKSVTRIDVRDKISGTVLYSVDYKVLPGLNPRRS